MLLGAGRAALHTPAFQPVAGADDRVPDQIRGVVAGPIERLGGGERWLLLRSSDGLPILVTTPARTSVLPGDRVVVTGRLQTPLGYRVEGAIDRSRVIAARGARLQMTGEVETIDPDRELSAWRAPARAHRALARHVESRGGDSKGNAVVRAMTLGDRSGLDLEVTEGFRRAGVTHVLAVSGLHLAVVAMLLFAAVRRVWAAVPALALRMDAACAAALCSAPAAVAYTAITGARVSTVRALLVVLIVLVGVAIGRRARVIDALGAAALIIMAVSPLAVYDPSFQLSFAATAILALAIAPGRRRAGLASIAQWIWSLVRASFWATLATMPFTALSFGTIHPGGVITNLLVVPVAELVVLPVGLAGVALSVWCPAIGDPLIDLATWVAAGLTEAVLQVAELCPVIFVSPPGMVGLIAAGACVTGAVCWARCFTSRRVAAALTAVGLALMLSGFVVQRASRRARTDLEIAFIDVGQGDAAVIEMPGGGVWLVDAGGRPFVVGGELSAAARDRIGDAPGEQAVSRYLAARGIGAIDRVVISHAHPDHYLGLRAVARRFDIAELWIAAPHPEVALPADFAALLVQLQLSGTKLVSPPLDTPIAAGGDVQVRVLHPRLHADHAATDPSLSVNDSSLVLKLERAGRAVLFAGDLEAESEELLVRRYGRSLRADVVKVGHHGSRTSSTQPFVDATRPAWAVISCGVANRFGFPAPEVVQRWQSRGATVLETRREGAVSMRIDPSGGLEISTWSGRRLRSR